MPLDKASIPNPDNIVRREYANGMTVLVRENFSSPSVVIDGLLRAGAADDPIGKEGLSSFTAHMVMRGTERRTFAQIYEEIEAVGATVDVGSGVNVASFGANAILSRRSRTSSTPVFDAASISIRSSDRPSVMLKQIEQALHGLAPVPVQLAALARIRATDVLPVPRGPVNR